ncbi:UNVERIFIED_ORG: hypothetical protein FHW05_004805 [Pantoea agglomerans]
MTGMQELKDHQEGKSTLKSYKVTRREPATIAPQELRGFCRINDSGLSKSGIGCFLRSQQVKLFCRGQSVSGGMMKLSFSYHVD